MSFIKKLKSNMWITQVVNNPKSFVNPFGASDVDLQSIFINVFDLKYMGAAEYEISNDGKSMFREYIKRMMDSWSNSYNEETSKFEYNVFQHWITHDGKDKRIFIVTDNIYKAYIGIMHIFNRSATEYNSGNKYYECSKRDAMSFYKWFLVSKEKEKEISRSKGWLPLKEDFAWFTTYEMANDFLNKIDEAWDIKLASEDSNFAEEYKAQKESGHYEKDIKDRYQHISE